MLTDLHFYYAAVPAVLLVGLTKGGMGEALALLGVPILSMVMPPVQAAAILLPILIVMDMVALWSWRHHNDRKTLLYMLPGGLLGILVGYATSAIVPGYVMRILIGTVAIAFAARYAFNLWRTRHGYQQQPHGHNMAKAGFWGTLAGYGSFIAHSGGAPYQVYTLPLMLDKNTYTGTAVRFFAILNAVKVVPYFALGELDLTNLTASVALIPLALLATMTGAWLVRKIKPAVFYPYMYAMVFLAGCKLLVDGLSAAFT
jgi:uncharacterized protein